MGYRILGTGKRFVIAFDGKLLAEEGVTSARAFSEALLPHDSVEAVWDIRRMTGYERAAREAWQSALWPLRHKIRNIVVVGGTPLVRIGATTIGLALGIQIAFEDEITIPPAGS
jgi:hypothetical protein